MGPRIRIEWRTSENREYADVRFCDDDGNRESLALGIVASYATARWPGTGWMHSEHACRLYRVAINSAINAGAVALDLDRTGTETNRKLLDELRKAAARLVGEDQVVHTFKNEDLSRALASIRKPTDPTDGLEGKSTVVDHV